jgi:hypothetical protein
MGNLRSTGKWCKTVVAQRGGFPVSKPVMCMAVILSLLISVITMPAILKALLGILIIPTLLAGLLLFPFIFDNTSWGNQKQMNFVSKSLGIPKHHLQHLFQLPPLPPRRLDKRVEADLFKKRHHIFDVERYFSQKDGVIIVLEVLPPFKPVHPADKPEGYYVIKIKKSKPGKEYYHIPNLRIVGLLDYNGRNLPRF